MITHTLRVAADAIFDKKGKNVVGIDLRPLGTALTDFFIICSADSTTAVGAIARNVVDKLQQDLGIKPARTQGFENNFWVILDYSDFVVHVFLTQYREFYRLEDLWADAPTKVYKERIPSRKKTKKTEEEDA